jgi:hypothetical protein
LETRALLSFNPPLLYDTAPFPRSVAVGDFNNDGRIDDKVDLAAFLQRYGTRLDPP